MMDPRRRWRLRAIALALFATAACCAGAPFILESSPGGGTRIGLIAAAMLLAFVLATAGICLWLAQRPPPADTESPFAAVGTPSIRDEDYTGLYRLQAGRWYRIERPFTDYHQQSFAVGELLQFRERHFIPYHGGHTLVFEGRPVYLQEELQRAVIEDFDEHFVPDDGPPPPVVPANCPAVGIFTR